MDRVLLDREKACCPDLKWFSFSIFIICNLMLTDTENYLFCGQRERYQFGQIVSQWPHWWNHLSVNFMWLKAIEQLDLEMMLSYLKKGPSDRR